MNTTPRHTENPMFRHPIQLGCNNQQKSAPATAGFAAELTLLSQHQPQLDHIELAVLKSYDWKPSVPDPIGKTPIPSVEEALREWARDMDDWHMADTDSWVSFDQAVDTLWCTRHKDKDRLKEFLKTMDFPDRYLEREVVSKRAYEKALGIQAARHEKRRKSKRKTAKTVTP